MRLYAEQSNRRNRQVAGDVVALLWLALWAWVGLRVHHLVSELADPGRAVEAAGNRMVDSAGDLAGEIRDVPVLGTVVGRGSGLLAQAGRELAAAGVQQQRVVSQLALWLGLAIALIPTSGVLLGYLPVRLRWARSSAAAARMRETPGSEQLLALRAVVRQPLRRLLATVDDPVGRYTRGDYTALAALELASLGLRSAPLSEGPSGGPGRPRGAPRPPAGTR